MFKLPSSAFYVQERIDYTLRLSHCLVDNEGKDPASLVQLAICLEERLEGLAKQVSIVSADGSVETSAAAEEVEDVQTVSGWRKSATSRVVFLPNRPSDEIAQLVSSVCWTSGQDADDWILKGLPEVCLPIHSVGTHQNHLTKLYLSQISSKALICCFLGN